MLYRISNRVQGKLPIFRKKWDKKSLRCLTITTDFQSSLTSRVFNIFPSIFLQKKAYNFLKMIPECRRYRCIFAKSLILPNTHKTQFPLNPSEKSKATPYHRRGGFLGFNFSLGFNNVSMIIIDT